MNLVTSKPASDIALAAPSPSREDADARPVAGTRADRHRAVRRFQAARRPRGHGRGNRRLHRRREQRLPRAEADARRTSRSSIGASSPRRRERTDAPELLGVSEIRDHAGDGAAGAMSVIGVKFTTARAVGARAAALAAQAPGRIDAPHQHRHDDSSGRRHLGSRGADHRDRARRRPGAGAADHQAPQRHLRRSLRRHRPAHGRAQRLAHAARARPAQRRRGSHPRHPRRDGVHARRHRHPPERARRDGPSGRRTRRRLRAIAAEELGWNISRDDATDRGGERVLQRICRDWK